MNPIWMIRDRQKKNMNIGWVTAESKIYEAYIVTVHYSWIHNTANRTHWQKKKHDLVYDLAKSTHNRQTEQILSANHKLDIA